MRAIGKRPATMDKKIETQKAGSSGSDLEVTEAESNLMFFLSGVMIAGMAAIVYLVSQKQELTDDKIERIFSDGDNPRYP